MPWTHITGPNAAVLLLILAAALLLTACGFPRCGVMFPC